MTITYSTFVPISVRAARVGGGGINLIGGTVAMTNTIVSHNVAIGTELQGNGSNGGGILSTEVIRCTDSHTYDSVTEG